MKNYPILVLMVLMLGVSIGSNAQNYGYYYTGNYYHDDNYLPQRVKRVVRHYHNFNWVRTAELQRGHRKLFILTLQNRNRFIELTVNRRGEVLKEHRYYVKNQYRRRAPYRYTYNGKKVIYYHSGYAYSGWDYGYQKHYDWDWDKKQNKNQHHSGQGNRSTSQRNRSW